MQLSQINELANNNNMVGVMTNLENMDKQLSSLLDIVNANSDNQTRLCRINQYHFTT